MPCTNQGSTESFARRETPQQESGYKYPCREILMPLSEAAPLGSAVLARDNTAPERISRRAQRAETPPSPTPQEGTPSPTLSVSAGVIDLPRLVLEIRDPSSRAVSAGCHGDGKRGHLLRCPRGGTRRCPGSRSPLGEAWDSLCLLGHTSGVHPPSSVPPSVTSQGSVPAGLAGAGVERGGDAGVSLVVSLHFPSFPSRAFLFSFLALPRPVAGPAPLPSDVHQWWQEETGLCRAVEGGREDKMLSCTRD